MKLFTFLLLFPVFALAQPNCASVYRKIFHENPMESLDREVLKEIQTSYFDLDRSSKSAVKKWNDTLLASLNEAPLPSSVGSRKPAVSYDEAKDLFKILNDHPVASCKQLPKYDPNKNIGFCFGRAVAGHLLALQEGVHKESVRKIWAVGTMHADNITWGHHVATMVRGQGGKWYVLDPEYKRVLTLETWIKKVKEMDADGKLMFLSSEAKRFGPATPDAYSAIELNSDFYNKYFSDLLAEMRKTARERK